MVQSCLTQLPLQQLTKLLQQREISCREILQAYLDKIHTFNNHLGAFLQVADREKLLSLADESDARWQKKQNKSALDGIPIAIKDNIHVHGLKTTCASRLLHNYSPPYEATCVEKLREAGAIFIGKTNLDEFAMGSTTENSATQQTHNPWDINKVAGGSSGGSAVAVSAGMSPLALGSDTGGSVRQPASFCGIVGLKPTYGYVSRYGLVAYASSLDQVGPMARDVYGATQLLNAIGGFDERDSTSIRSAPVALEALQRNIAGKKIAILGEISNYINPHVAKVFEQSIESLRSLGAEVTEVEFPFFDYVVAAYYLIATAEASSNLARYDGVKYGQREERKTYQEMLTATRSQGFGKEVKKRILLGNFVLSSGYYDAYYLKAQKMRRRICHLLNNILHSYDAIVTPTTPNTAFTKGESEQDFMKVYVADVTTVIANLTGLPAVSIPCGMVENLPVGLQIIGGALQEQQILNIAYQFEKTQQKQFIPKLENIDTQQQIVHKNIATQNKAHQSFSEQLQQVRASYKAQPQHSRIYNNDLANHVAKEVTICGWVHKINKLGGVEFMIIRDATGFAQVVVENSSEKYELETVVRVTGIVAREKRSPYGEIEIAKPQIEVVGHSYAAPPLSMSTNPEGFNLPTVLDNRPVSLRNPQILSTFKIQSLVVRFFSGYLRSQNFFEIKTPKIISTGTEGGSNIFPLDYFGRKVYLAQSPQFYKQTMVGSGLERVFEVGPVFRAERHSTTRHLNEYTSLDFEMGFIHNEQDVIDMQEKLLRHIFQNLQQTYADYVTDRTLDLAIPDTIPRIHFLEALEIIKSRGGKAVQQDDDISSIGEQVLHKYCLEEHNSHFVYVIGYPQQKRPVYTMPDERLPGYTRSFDLLYKGIEITTGGQRIHDYEMLCENIRKGGGSLEDVKDYLSIFKHGMPPHGGLGMGLERLTMKIMGHDNVRHASLFPRDIHRVSP
ncbi:Asp-tRNA(Asn)/Glu-tRNA(Gln) amidotransferase subunit GatA [Candidatus Uabimicrobium amorphum]|uniref:Multifunctional fusion protein n=1 Tax=Uabimicrobium amorphum TaxID=2596890 RepID=A0A5S9F0S0_UABAM|nr:Asp-tRNA(Asn)/Glu-tRNA(Gln) amidotransferase subunit GatA [Candidatus Uabimicrobium amorphum]BBM81905.1 glutamyl-tRNA(Gln) amidotransferase subunit A [Candidatus Uabimicrobium amorphum]